MSKIIKLASRKSPLALKQAYLAADFIEKHIPGAKCEIIKFTTTGDRQTNWSLEQKGGKGLFTKELEEALLRGEANFAVHSAKDLPTEMPEGLVIAGFLERERPNDILVRNIDLEIKTLATGSPRRRAQAQILFPDAQFQEIRGNVATRLEKIADREADATILAAAGLRRLGIGGFDGLVFEELSLGQMVPAVGQGAIALQAREDWQDSFEGVFCRKTRYAVELERIFLEKLGGGCHAAYAAHYQEEVLRIFHQKIGFQEYEIKDNLSMAEQVDAVDEIIRGVL